jgi:predicted amidohydrolase
VLELASELGASVGAGLIEDGGDGGLFNTYVVAMPDGSIAKHRKLHTFISEHMRSGDTFTVFDLPGGWRASILTCYDNNLVENARMSALLGADLIIAPHQTGGCESSSPHGMKRIDPELWHARATDPDPIRAACQGENGRGWLMRWLPSRAHDNGVFLVFSNGVGIDDDEVRTGNSMILDPYGRILAETDAVDADIVVADLDPGLLEWSTGARWIKVRRPELYAQLAERQGDESDTRTVRFARIDS